MSLFYRIAYSLGIAPWEHAASHPAAASHVAALFDREALERPTGPGSVLDIGCGTGIWSADLARRGWRVTGVDTVASALKKARRRASAAGVAARFIQADITQASGADIGSEYDLFWDFGAIHGFNAAGRAAAGRALTKCAANDATLLLLAWRPAFRGPLPRGATREEIEAAFPDWKLIDAEPFDATGLPPPLRKAEPRMFRLRRT